MKKIISLILVCFLVCMVFAENAKLRFSYDKFKQLNWTEGKELVSEKSTRKYSAGLYDYFIEQIYKDPNTGDCYVVLYSIGKIQSIKYSMKGWDGIDTNWIYYVSIENVGKLL